MTKIGFDLMPNQNRKITELLPYPTPPQEIENERLVGLICPNCGGRLEGRKCKLVCTRRGCGYLVTCSEW